MLGVASLMDVACLVKGAGLVTRRILNNSPLGACLIDIASLMDVACLIIRACLVARNI